MWHFWAGNTEWAKWLICLYKYSLWEASVAWWRLWVTLWVFEYLGCRRWRYSIDSCICWGCERRCCWRNPQTVSDSSSRTCRMTELTGQTSDITHMFFSHLCFHSLVRHRLHELVDQLVVLLSSDSLVLQSDVQRVIEQRLRHKSIINTIAFLFRFCSWSPVCKWLPGHISNSLILSDMKSVSDKRLHQLIRYLVVCADVQQHGETLLRSNSTAGCVERQLPHRYAHTVGSQVTQAEDTLPVRHHDGLHEEHISATCVIHSFHRCQ